MRYTLEVEVNENELMQLAEIEGIEYGHITELIQSEMGWMNNSGITCLGVTKSAIETPYGVISSHIDDDPAYPNITVFVDDTAFARVEYTDEQGVRAICYDKEHEEPLLIQPWSSK